jgi:hypothetical protein
MKNRNYNQVQANCIEDPKEIWEEAIGSSSAVTTRAALSADEHHTAGDETTWGGAPGAFCARGKGPPQWHLGLEVEDDLLSPAGGSRRR